MVILVETNFILELAFEQEQHEHCRALLNLAREHREEVELALPAFSFGEAYHRQIGQQRARLQLQERLIRELNQLSRSRPYTERSKELSDLTGFLVSSGEDERRRLESVLDELLDAATIIPLTVKVIAEASRLQKMRDLSPQDALVYSSVLQLLQEARRAEPQAEHCFITRDAGDFGDPDIKSDLAGLDCKILFRFENGLDYVRNVLE